MKTISIVFDALEDIRGFEYVLQSEYLKEGEYCESTVIENRGGDLNYMLDITVEDSNVAMILPVIEEDTEVGFFDINGEVSGIEFGSDEYEGVLGHYAEHKEERKYLHW